MLHKHTCWITVVEISERIAGSQEFYMHLSQHNQYLYEKKSSLLWERIKKCILKEAHMSLYQINNTPLSYTHPKSSTSFCKH